MLALLRSAAATLDDPRDAPHVPVRLREPLARLLRSESTESEHGDPYACRDAAVDRRVRGDQN